MHRLKLLLFCLPVAINVALPSASFAATYYCDPVDGHTTTGDGSAENPWGTLESVFDAGLIQRRAHKSYPADPNLHPDTDPDEFTIKNSGTAVVVDGDIIKLRSGYHGELNELEYYNIDYITIKAEEGHTPIFGQIKFESFEKWKIIGVTVDTSAKGSYGGSCISAKGHGHTGPCSHIYIENCTVRTIESAPTWNADDWRNNASTGIHAVASNNVIRGNTIKNVFHGIIVGGENSLVENNTITQFAVDGVSVGGGNNQILQNNIIKNAKSIGIGHRDAIRLMTPSTVSGMVIRGNTIIECEDPGQPFASRSMHGIFGGVNNKDLRIENNLIVIDHLWGIYVSNLQNATIINNTVVRPPKGATLELPVIKTLGTNVNVKNNIAFAFTASAGIVASHNLDIDNQSECYSLFNDYYKYDFSLKGGSPAVDAGTDSDAPGVDISGNVRPAGSGYDIGCYEYVPSGSNNQAPNADAGQDQTVTDSGGNGKEKVTLDGSGSTDSDGTIVSWVWTDNLGDTIPDGVTTKPTLSVGTHTITLTVTEFSVLYQSSYAIAGDAGVFSINDRLGVWLCPILLLYL